MSGIYDNWERLVGATMKREQLRLIALADSRDSSYSSILSDSTSHSPLHDQLGSLSGPGIGVFELKAILSSNGWKVEDLMEIEGAPEALVKLIKEPISLNTTIASLSAIFQLVVSSATFSNKKAAAYFAEIGLVQVLVEMLVDSERSICEKALGVLDGICSSSEGMETAYENALTVPVLVKKILTVSDLATQFSVSILWKLGKNENRGEGVILEAREAGAFHRLMVLLQVGCDETTRKIATELLNLYKNVRTMFADALQENLKTD